MQKLDIPVKKSNDVFQENYTKHDMARDIVCSYMRQRHIKVIDYGEDRRHEKVWAAGKDRPDALIWKPELNLAFVDWKGHDDHNWMLNERAYKSYVEHGERYSLPIFCLWVVLPEKAIYYAKLPFKNPIHDIMPHDLNKIVKCVDNEVSNIDKLAKQLSLYKQLELSNE